MASSSDLPRILGQAYSERMQGYGSSLHEFFTAAKDAGFLKHAKAEHARLSGLEKSLGCPLALRCYASAHQLAFLKTALLIPIPKTPQEEKEMPAKLKSLAGLAKEAVADVEKQAEDAMAALNSAKKNAEAGVGKLNAVSAEIQQAAKELNSFAAQTSNFPSDEQ